MSGRATPGLTQRVMVLTSMFCLVSVDQKVHAASEHSDRHQIRASQIGERRALIQAQRQERMDIRDALRPDRKVQIRHDREVLRNTSWRPENSHNNAIQRHDRGSNQLLSDFVQNPVDQSPKFTGTVSDTGRTARQIDLDLTSSSSKIILGSKLFNDSASVTIDVGGEKQTFHAGSQVTAGQFVAIKQVLEGGTQSLILDKNGAAAGGSFSLNSVAGPKVSDLVVSAGVTGFDDFATDRRIGVRGDFTNFGSIVATSSNDRITSGVIFGKNINNEGGSITAGTNDPAVQINDLELTLSASDRIKNSGSIASTGTLTLDTGSGSVSNTGVVSSLHGDINISSADPTKTIEIQAKGGRFEALAGNINARDINYSGAADVSLRGGDYLSKTFNIYSGSGNIDGVVDNVTGQLNTVAGVEHFYASTELLKIGNNCITGDPTFANSAGGIQIQGQNTFGEAVAFLASGDITADSTAQIIAHGFNVSMVAGAKITVSAGPETTTIPGTPIGAGTTATVDFSAGTGGNIDLTGSSVGTIIDTSSSTGNAGSVVLAAHANGATGGTIKLSSTSLVDTSSSFTDGNGGSLSAFAGANPAAPSVTLQLGSITSNAGPGTGSAGDVKLSTAQPTGTGGASVTFDSLGQVSSGGPIIAGTAATNGQIKVNNITAKSSSTGGTLSAIASDSLTAGTIDVTGSVALAGSSVTPASITSAADINILTATLHNDGDIKSTKASGSIFVQGPAGLTLEGSGSFSLTGGGSGQMILDANGDYALALTSSHTFNPGSTGSVTFTSESQNGSITIAPAITLTVNDGATVNIGTPFLNFLGDGAALNATMASAIKITSGGLPFPLMIATPDAGSVTISTTGGSIDISPTGGSDLLFINMAGTNESTLNLMGGPVTTNTVAATTFVSSAMHLNSDNSLAMSAGGAGGIMGLGFQPYVGGFVNGNATTQFDGYSLDTVKALMQQLKNDGYTDVATYSQGSFYFGGQFFGPTSPTAGSNKFNIQAAAAVGLGISAGVFQQGVNGDGFNVADTMQEVTYILQQAQLYPGTVKEIIIGNESILGPNSLNDLNTLISQAIAARNATPVTQGSGTMFSSATLPITTRQRWDVIAGVNNNANPLQGALKTLLTTVEGHVYANMYAYFDGNLPDSWSTAPSDQGAFTTAVTNSMNGTLGALKTAFNAQGITTQVRIGETGWPTQGLRAPPLSTAPALGNVTLANWYFQAMKTWSASNNIPTVVFQAYDQPWQTVPAAQVPTTAGSSEGFFGLYTANGTSTQTSFTLTSITNKFASGFSIASIGTGSRMVSNSGTITAANVVINTPVLDNNGTISSISALGSVAVSASTDLDVTGTGSITRTGGGTGGISFTTNGANDLEVRGIQTINAGAGNAVSFNAMDDGASFTLSQGAVINLPTNDTKLAINSEHFLRNGSIDTHSVTNPNTTVTVNATGDSTIACSVGTLDISGMDINVSTGHLALLSAGDIINSGSAISLDLNSGVQGGNLIMMAGYSFKELVLGTDDPFYVLDSTSTTTGNVIFNAAGHEVNINTSGAAGGGNVDLYANGSVALNNILTGGGSGTSGSVTIAGSGISTGNIDTTATSPASSGAVSIQSGTVVHNGVQVQCGTITGAFSVNSLAGNISVGDVTVGESGALIQTNGATSAISFTAAVPSARDLALLAGTGTLNLPSSNISVTQNSANGDGGSLKLSASNFAGVTAPLVLNAEAIGSGKGGSVSYINTSTADLFIDQSVLQILANGIHGGSATISGGGNVAINMNAINITPDTKGIVGDGASYDFTAGSGGQGTLLITGAIDASPMSGGKYGDVKLTSNSTRTFKIGSSRVKNGIQIDQIATAGSLSVTNNGGGIAISKPLTVGIESLTLDTGKATRGTISLKDEVVAKTSINLTVGGNGHLSSKLFTAPAVTINGGSRAIRAIVDTQLLTANISDSLKIQVNSATMKAITTGAGPLALAFSGSSTLLDSSTEGDFIVTSDGDLTLNDISVGNGSLSAAARGKLSVAPGANLVVNSNGAPGIGTLALAGSHRNSSTIFIGAGSTIETSGTGGGDVSIFIGSQPRPKGNPLTPGLNGNFFVTTSGGGQVYADLSTIVANAPTNALNAIGKNVVIDGGKNAAITIDGGVIVTADPPVNLPASLSLATVTPNPSPHEQNSGSTNLNLTASGFQSASFLSPNSASNNSTTANSSFLTSNALLSAFNPDSLNLNQTPVTPSDLLSASGSFSNSISSKFGASEKFGDPNSVLNAINVKTTSQAVGTRTRESVPEHSQLIESGDYVSGEIDAVHLTETIPQNGSVPLSSGSFLCTPGEDTIFETSLANVKVDKGAMVLVMVRDQSLAIFNLHDTHKNAVQVKVGESSLALSPGRQAVLTRSKSDQFHLVNPAEIFQYRDLTRKLLAGGIQMFSSEFCIPTALLAIKPAKQLLASTNKTARRLTDNVLKTTAIVAELNRSTTPFEEMPHPKLTVYQK